MRKFKLRLSKLSKVTQLKYVVRPDLNPGLYDQEIYSCKVCTILLHI